MKIIGKIWERIIRPLSKARYYWKSSSTPEEVRILYYSDNSIYFAITDRYGHTISLVVDSRYTGKLKEWLNTHHYEEKVYEPGGKVVPLTKKFSIRKSTSSSGRDPKGT